MNNCFIREGLKILTLALKNKSKTFLFIVFFILCTSISQLSESKENQTLNKSADSLRELSISGASRLRLENHADSIRANSANNQILTMRTSIEISYTSNLSSLNLELMDSRQALAETDGPINSGDVNVLDIQQLNFQTKFGLNKSHTLKIGRFTTNHGNRRLVARPVYRNTMNTFDGLELVSRFKNGKQIQILASQPVLRKPEEKGELIRNDFTLDKSSSALRFYGATLDLPDVSNIQESLNLNINPLNADFFGYLLREKDTLQRQSKNRKLRTFGFRLKSEPESGKIDIEIHSSQQSGTQRASLNPMDQRDLRHKAFFRNFVFGYTFQGKQRARVSFEFDHGSGDSDPGDNKSERYDSLFGVTAPLYGPTGFYGVFNMSNTITPGLRLSFNPTLNLNLMLSYRHFWLDATSDSLGRSKKRARKGTTDNYVGQHLELRSRWNPLDSVRVETGVVFLALKNFRNRNSTFFWFGAERRF